VAQATSVSGRPGRLLVGAAILAALAACGPREEILPGERYGLRETREAAADFAERAEDRQVALEEPPQPPSRVPIRGFSVTGEPRAITLPAQRTNDAWTHVNGTPQHRIVHPALAGEIGRVWSAEIGRAGTRRVRATADPVVGGGRIYTMSAFSEVQATGAGGQAAWRRDLTPATESPGQASGGGLAYDDGRLYVTTGYGTLFVLDAASGATLWRQDLGAVPNSAPTVAPGFVYLTTRDARAWALDRETGRILWQIESTETGSVVIDGAAPALTDRAVIFPFGSGDVIAALRQGGRRLWSSIVTGRRVGETYAEVGDITADPVVDGGRVYVGTPTGRLAALDATTGERIWTATEGSNSAVWPTGGAVFLTTDKGEVARLDAGSGEVVWTAALPYYREERVSARRGVFAHYGPVLAGGRLIVVSSDGLLRQIDPASGALLAQTELGAPAAGDPVVANRTLYVVTEDGRLHAFR